MLSAMRARGIKLEKEDNKDLADYMIGIHRVHGFDYPPEFFDRVAALWKDSGVREVFDKAHEYQLIDSAE